MFNGSENYKDDCFKVMEAAGATELNGTTWFDRTNYFQNVPTSALDMTLWMESDRMGHLLGAIDQKVLDEQRGVVQNEKRQGENQPYGKVSELITHEHLSGGPSVLLGNHRLDGRPQRGLARRREGLVPHLLRRRQRGAGARRRHHRRGSQSRRSRSTSATFPSGPVITRQQEWVAKMTGDAPRHDAGQRAAGAHLQGVEHPGLQAARFHAARHGVATCSAAARTAGSTSAWCTPIAPPPRSRPCIGPFEIGSQLQIIVTVKPGGDPAVVEKALDEELARFLATGPTAAELERIRTTNYANFARGIERIDGFGGKSSILAESQVYRRLAGFLQDAARLDRERHAGRRAGRGEALAVRRRVRAQRRAGADVQDRRLARSIAARCPTTGAPPSLKLPAPQRAKLSNGLEVVVVERHNAPVVDFTLIADAGFAADASGQARHRAPRHAHAPGRHEDPHSLADRRARRIARRAARRRLVARSLVPQHECAERPAPESLDLYADVLLNPTFPDKELERLRGQTLATIQQEKAQPHGHHQSRDAGAAVRRGPCVLDPSSGTGTEAAVESLTSAELAAFYKRWVRPDNSMLLVVGDTTLAQIQPLLEQRFGGWRAPAEALPKKNIADVALAGQAARVPHRPAGRGAVADRRRHRGPDARRSGSHPLRRARHHARRQLHLAPQHEPARGQALGVRRAARASPMRSGRARSARAPACRPTRPPSRWSRSARSCARCSTTRKPDDAELKFAQDSIAIALPGNNETSDEIADSYGEILTFGLKDSYWNDFVGDVDVAHAGGRQQVRGQADSSGRADLGGGRRSVEDRGEGARAELRRGHGARRGRQAGRAVVSRRLVTPLRRAPSTASAPRSR